MLQIKSLGKAFRGEWLFRSLDFQINERDRIGLVGDNGTGKSTLMKMLAGLDAGGRRRSDRRQRPDFRLSSAGWPFLRGRTLLEEVLSVFESLIADGARDPAAGA